MDGTPWLWTCLWMVAGSMCTVATLYGYCEWRKRWGASFDDRMSALWERWNGR